MATYNKPDWKERAKPLTESDFFVDFDAPTVELDPPAVEPVKQLKTWICWYDNRDVGTVQAYDEEEAMELFMDTYSDEYFFDSWDHDFYVTEAEGEDLEESVEEPDNAVVDCKINKVIAHCEDEKPVDCKGEKKPLEKPLTEATEKKIFEVSYRENGVSKSFTVEAKDKAEAEKIAWSQVDVDDIYVSEI